LVTKLAKQYSESDFGSFLDDCTPEIVCDSSRWFQSDLKFVEKDIFGGALADCKFLHAPLSRILQLVDSKSVLVFCFQPNNPVRQMMVDMVRQSYDKPRAIFCAEASGTPPSRREGVFEADRSSPRVVEFFKGY
jgi:hypothetical protein